MVRKGNMRGRLRADYKLVNAVGPDEERRNKSEFMSFLSKFKDIKNIKLTDNFSEMLGIEFAHISTRSKASQPEFFSEYRGRVKSLTTDFVKINYVILRDGLITTNELSVDLDMHYANVTCDDVAQLFDTTWARKSANPFRPIVTLKLNSLNFSNKIEITMTKRREIPFIFCISMSETSP
ncbi:hypothetical protein [Acetobacter nitrogenifigens]|nr:hypothetical protein [Acetobacter nitrogenifigens]